MLKVTKFFKLSRVERVLFLEAVLTLALACFYVRFFAFKSYIYRVGESLAQEPEKVEAVVDQQLLQQISRTIVRAAGNVPWDAVCLPQAIAGKWMLKRRKISSIMFLGVAKEDVGVDGNRSGDLQWRPGLKAHAWLKVGDFFITGHQGHQQCTVVGRFK